MQLFIGDRLPTGILISTNLTRPQRARRRMGKRPRISGHELSQIKFVIIRAQKFVALLLDFRNSPSCLPSKNVVSGTNILPYNADAKQL
jgi:hypothetical protein